MGTILWAYSLRSCRDRFTPTHVGTITYLRPLRTCTPVHPHARGDDSRRFRSSSRTSGFTPTHVGTMLIVAPCRRCPAVHPHARGDDYQWHLPVWGRERFTPTHVGTMLAGLLRSPYPTGSPPRTWGRSRPIPFFPSRQQGLAVHPHARGDDADAVGLSRIHGGACAVHPHARGDDDRADPRLAAARVWRFTPTHVGTMRISEPHPSRLPVHPHARGDDYRADTVAATNNGSPPRTWGRFERDRKRQVAKRFTPTHVGTIPSQQQCALPYPVHPHARGDDWSSRPSRSSVIGSPPRTWGRSYPEARTVSKKIW